MRHKTRVVLTREKQLVIEKDSIKDRDEIYNNIKPAADNDEKAEAMPEIEADVELKKM